ncbi:MAG: DUF3109 family protein [Rhodothermales bacterium]|nr:DUF3109 family protein [Rhodothermales bacterium]
MFVVDHILISDDVAEARFACNLGACHGACCVQGDAGAPLEEHELAEIDSALETVRHRMRPEALKVVGQRGAWERGSDGSLSTTCVGEAECVFVRYDGPVAKCLIQEAHERGESDFPKPISCHLYPIRVTDLGDFEALNVEQMPMCLPAVKKGERDGTFLSDYLEWPLTRRYGAAWYDDFDQACTKRRSVFAELKRPAG